MRLQLPQPLRAEATVSVVIPCYNYGHFLPDAVASAFDQTGLDIEVIIVDDASPDGSVEVAHRLAAEDPRIRVIAHEVNAGHIQTYNDGLAEATGEFVVLLSADDRLHTDALTRAVALMQRHEDVGLVYGHPEDFTTEPEPDRRQPTSWTLWEGHRWLGSLARRGINVILSPEVVLRREAWLELGGYDPRLPHSADLSAWLHVASRWDVARINGCTQAHYRVHGNNMHLTTWAGMLTDLAERRRTYDLFFTENDSLPEDARALHSRTRKALSLEARRLAEAKGLPYEEREALIDFADETWQQGSHRATPAPSPLAAVPLLAQTRAKVRESVRYHRWKAVGL